MTADGNKEILLGFDDGTIQVYSIDPEDYQLIPPRLLFSQVILCLYWNSFQSSQYLSIR